MEGFLIKRRPDWKNMPERHIVPNKPDLSLTKNFITTSKYTCLTFIPINLFEQFSKLANLYFLVIGKITNFTHISFTIIQYFKKIKTLKYFCHKTRNIINNSIFKLPEIFS